MKVSLKQMIVIGAFILLLVAMFTGQLTPLTDFLQGMFGGVVSESVLEEAPAVPEAPE